MRALTPKQLRAFWGKVQKTDGCWLWTGATDSSGYGHLKLDGKTVSAHLLAYELAMGEPVPAGLYGCHGCDVPACVRVHSDHVFAGTPQRNVRDAIRRGRFRAARGDANGSRIHQAERPRGEEITNARLTAAKVHAIRALRASGWTHAAIAECLEVDRSTVGGVLQGRRWRHVA